MVILLLLDVSVPALSKINCSELSLFARLEVRWASVADSVLSRRGNTWSNDAMAIAAKLKGVSTEKYRASSSQAWQR
jgi:hypothetical protein